MLIAKGQVEAVDRQIAEEAIVGGLGLVARMLNAKAEQSKHTQYSGQWWALHGQLEAYGEALVLWQKTWPGCVPLTQDESPESDVEQALRRHITVEEVQEQQQVVIPYLCQDFCGTLIKVGLRCNACRAKAIAQQG